MSEMRVCLLTIGLAAAVGCKTSDTQAPSAKREKAPKWITASARDGFYSAVGICGPTLFRKNAIDYAREDALKQLALTLQVKVKAVVEETRTETSSRREEWKIVDSSKIASEVVLNGAEFESVWYDAHGIAGPARTTYVLARIPKNKVSLP